MQDDQPSRSHPVPVVSAGGGEASGSGTSGRVPGAETLDRLWATVLERAGAPAASSYTASLLAGFPGRPAQKLAEETAECVIEAVAGNREALIRESADMLYHLVVLLAGAGVQREAVFAELAAREKRARRKAPAKRWVLRKTARRPGGTSKIP